MKSRSAPIWAKIDDKLKYLAPIFMVLLLVYFYSSFVTPILSKEAKQYLVVVVIGYFVFELFLKYLKCGDWKEFLREYWLEIILLVPFFKGLKLLGAVGKVLKLLKYIPYAQKAAKLPKIIQKSKDVVLKLAGVRSSDESENDGE